MRTQSPSSLYGMNTVGLQASVREAGERSPGHSPPPWVSCLSSAESLVIRQRIVLGSSGACL